MSAAAWILALAVAAPPKVIVEQLDDGTELVFVRVPGAKETAFRWVVRSGGAADPPGMAGLAHLLEHAIFHGSYATAGDEVWNPVRRGGGRMNAFTTPDYTYYVLDAPKSTFWELASAYLEVITNPALMVIDLESERGVVANEGVLRSETGLLWMVDQLLFSGVERGATVLGTRRTRDVIQRTDLVKFYEENYIPSNTTAIVAGDLELEDAVKLIEENTRLPPNLPEERVYEKRGDVNLPLTEKTFAAYNVTIIGYELAGVDRATCRELAALLQLRLMVAAQIERPLATQIEPYCARLRGHDFLFVFMASRSHEGGALPDVINATIARATRDGPSGREREMLRARGKRALEMMLADPAAIAEALVQEAAIPPRGSEKRRFDAVLSPPKIDPSALLKAARASFREKRRLEIRLSPFGG